MSTSSLPAKYQLRPILFQATASLVVVIVTSWAISWFFRDQWRQLPWVIYAQPEPEPVVVALDTDNDEATIVIEPLPTPTATFSSTFINDLIQAVLDATSEAQATSEAELILQEFTP